MYESFQKWKRELFCTMKDPPNQFVDIEFQRKYLYTIMKWF
jgi:hypothetical protein